MIIWAIARTTFGDAVRKKVLQIFVVVTIGLIVMSVSFTQMLSFSTKQGISTELMMLKSFGLGLMAIAGALISLILGVSLIPQEIERRTIYTILAKPVNRYQFIIGKYLGLVMTLATTVGLMGVVFVATVMMKAATSQAPVLSATSAVPSIGSRPVQIFDIKSVYGVLMIFLQFTVLSSVVLFLSVFLAPTVNFFMGMGVYLIGIMASVTQTFGQAGSGLLKTFYAVLYEVMPNFDKFQVTNPILHPDPIFNLGRHVAAMTVYAVLYSLGMMLLAILLFERKEV